MIEVQFLSRDGETKYGWGIMPYTPRVGEYVWLQNESGAPVYLYILDVCYWVPNGKDSSVPEACTSAAVHVEVVESEEANE